MRRFNYTGRQKIKREHVALTVNSTSKNLRVNAVLESYEFPSDSNVFLEAQRQNRYMRFRVGQVNRLDSRAHSLTEFDDLEGVQFGLKVVEPDHGKLLGVVNRIIPVDNADDDRPAGKGILPVRSTDLSDSGLLWKVDATGGNFILEIEKELGAKEQVVRSILFRSFVLPAAMREILLRIVSTDWDETLSDASNPETAWLLYAKDKCAGLPEKSESLEDYSEWLDETSRILASRIGVRGTALDQFGERAW